VPFSPRRDAGQEATLQLPAVPRVAVPRRQSAFLVGHAPLRSAMASTQAANGQVGAAGVHASSGSTGAARTSVGAAAVRGNAAAVGHAASWDAAGLLFDAHCHLQLPRLLEHVPDVVATAQRSGVRRAAVCGCERRDWQTVARLADEHPGFVAPQFGVHPWWAALHEGANADADSENWVEALARLLRSRPAAGVGECGLDAARKRDIPLDVQMAVLMPQLALARELARPVSLHCVGAHGSLQDVLQRVFGKKGHKSGLVLHSYCGSVEMVTPFLKLNCFFSFSASILHIPKHMAALKAVPLDRLLLETDSPDQMPRLLCSPCEEVPARWGAALGTPRRDAEGPFNEPALLTGICIGAADALGIDPEELARVTAENACRVFDFAT